MYSGRYEVFSEAGPRVYGIYSLRTSSTAVRVHSINRLGAICILSSCIWTYHQSQND